MHVLRPLVPLLLAATTAIATAATQSAPQVDDLTRYADESVAGALDVDGEVTLFHLDVRESVCRLYVGAKHSDEDGAEFAAPGSSEAVALLAGVRKWLASELSADEQRSYLEPDDVTQYRDPITGERMAWPRYLTVHMLRAVHRYDVSSAQTIDNVHDGNGAIRLSFKWTDGAGRSQQVFLRTVDESPFPRVCLGASEEPLTVNSRAELDVCVAVARWLRRSLGDDAWSAAASDALPDATPAAVASVFGAYRQYRIDTGPRLRQVARYRDGGSVGFVFTDALDRELQLFFDNQIGSETRGNLKADLDGKGLKLVEGEFEGAVRAFVSRWIERAEAGHTPSTEEEREMLRTKLNAALGD